MIVISFLSVVFVFSLVFFTQINPIVIFDADDWGFATHTRLAIPLWGIWNPSRVFPEIFMSFCSYLGVFFIKPFTNDYIGSISFAYGLIVSVFVWVYVYRFTRLIHKKFQLNCFSLVIVSALFFLFHFWAFRTAQSDNNYLFSTEDATCYFFYVIPNLLNASLVMYFCETDYFEKHYAERKGLLGFIILSVYLGIFSNLFPSIILVSYLSFVALRKLILIIKRKERSLKTVFAQLAFPVSAIIVWLISLLFEASGGRASEIGGRFNLLGTVKQLLSYVLKNTNRWFDLFVVVLLIVMVLLTIVNLKRKNNTLKKYSILIICFVFCFLITTVFNILVCSKTINTYIGRGDILFGSAFYAFLILSIAICVVFEKYSLTTVFVPLLLLIIISTTFLGARTFKQSNKCNLDYETCKSLDEYIISQVYEADEKHQTEVEVHVPAFEFDENWPIADYSGERISRLLYQNHIIHNEIQITIIPDEECNLQFGIPIPD